MHLQVSVTGPRLSTNPAILQLSEVALKERNLMLVRRAWNIGVRSLDGEMVEDGSLVDGSFGLGNQLCSPHVAVPLGGGIDCDLGALRAARVTWVLVGGGEIDVAGGGAGSVDVVLVV